MILKELKIDTWIGDPTNCYIVLDEESKETMVIDPAGDVDKIIEMLDTILITVLIVAICIALLSIGIFLKGKFPNTHVSGNKALRKKGIGCVQSQDREARKPNKNAIAEIEK